MLHIRSLFDEEEDVSVILYLFEPFEVIRHYSLTSA